MTNSNVKIKCPHCGKEIAMADGMQEKIYQSINLLKMMHQTAEQINHIEREIADVECQIKIADHEQTNAKQSQDLKCLLETLKVLHCKLRCLKDEQEKLNQDFNKIENIKNANVHF